MYRVVWEIELDAASAIDAAEQARRIQMDGESIALCYDVTPTDGGATERVDLWPDVEE
jgi:hypothetical protein